MFHLTSNTVALFVLALVVVLALFGSYACMSLTRAGWRQWLMDLTDRLHHERAGYSHRRAVGWDTRDRFQKYHGRTMRADVDWALYHLGRRWTLLLVRPVSWLHYHLLYLPTQRRRRAHNAHRAQRHGSLSHGWRG